MSNKSNKYGSPYDPNYSGKQMRPQDRKDEERRELIRRQHQLRGCDDPSCSMCNPETASSSGVERPFTLGERYSSPGVERRYTVADTYPSINAYSWSDPVGAAFADMVRDRFRELTEESVRGPRAEPSPSAAYKQAREKVQDYICPAPEQAFEDIIGNDDALEQLRDAIQAPVKHKELYAAYGMKMPKGALLSGPPGCGKTMFARAAASEMRRLYGDKVEFISISGSELQSMFVGETEKRIKAIFTFAREYQAHHGHPLLVFMDEAEVLLPDRTGRVRRVASWEESQVATFLAEMDGMQESGAFVLLATNRPEVIDQAVLRDGRCDFKITVKRPTQDAIRFIVEKNFAGVPLGKDTLDQLVFAAVEGLFDPSRIIIEANRININLTEQTVQSSVIGHFALEHIVSGAMAASIPNRARRYAFARDKASGTVSGVTVEDVIRSVQDLFDENRGLDHSFALNEWRREMEKQP